MIVSSANISNNPHVYINGEQLCEPYITSAISTICNSPDFSPKVNEISHSLKLKEEACNQISEFYRKSYGRNFEKKYCLESLVEKFRERNPQPTVEELITFQFLLVQPCNSLIDKHVQHLKAISPNIVEKIIKQRRLQSDDLSNLHWMEWLKQLSKRQEQHLQKVYHWLFSTDMQNLPEIDPSEEIMSIVRYIQFTSAETKQIFIEELERLQKSSATCSSQSSTEINGNDHIPIVRQEVPQQVHKNVSPLSENENLDRYILTTIEKIHKTNDFNRVCEEISAQSAKNRNKRLVVKKEKMIESLNTLYQGETVTPQASLLQTISERFEQQRADSTFEELIVFQSILRSQLDRHVEHLKKISPNFLNERLQQDQLQQKNFEWQNKLWLRWVKQLEKRHISDLFKLYQWLEANCKTELTVSAKVMPIVRYLRSASSEVRQRFIGKFKGFMEINGDDHIPIVHQEVQQQVHKKLSPLSESEHLDHYILTTIEKIRKTVYFNRLYEEIIDQSSKDKRRSLVEKKEKMIESLNTLYRGKTITPQASLLQIISERFEQQIPHPTVDELIVFQSILHSQLDRYVEHLKNISPNFLNERLQQDQLQQKNVEWQNKLWLRWFEQLEQNYSIDLFQLYQWLEANCKTELTVSAKVMPIVRYLKSAPSNVRQRFIGKFKDFTEINGNNHIPIVHQEVPQQVHKNVSPLSESENLDHYILTTIEKIRKTDYFNRMCKQITAQSSKNAFKNFVVKKEIMIKSLNTLYRGETITPQASLLQIISERFEQQIPHPTFDELIVFQSIVHSQLDRYVEHLKNISPNFLNERLQQDQLQQKNFEWQNNPWLRWVKQLEKKHSTALLQLYQWVEAHCKTELTVSAQVMPIVRYLKSAPSNVRQLFIEKSKSFRELNGNSHIPIVHQEVSQQVHQEVPQQVHQEVPIVHQEVPQQVHQEVPIVHQEVPQQVHQEVPIVHQEVPQQVHQEVPIVHQEVPQQVHQEVPIVHQEVPQQVHKNLSPLSESENLDRYILTTIEEIRKTDYFNRLCEKITAQSSKSNRKNFVSRKEKRIKRLNTLYQGKTITPQASLLQIISERFEQQIPHPTFDELIVFQSILRLKLDRHVEHLKKISPNFLNERLQQDQLQQKNFEWQNNPWLRWVKQLEQEHISDFFQLYQWLEANCKTELTVSSKVMPIVRYLKSAPSEVRQLFIGKAKSFRELNGNNHNHYILTTIEKIHKTDYFNRLCEKITVQSSKNNRKNFVVKKEKMIESLNTLYRGETITPQASLLQAISERFEQQIPHPTFEELILFQSILRLKLDRHVEHLKKISPNFLNERLQQDQLQQKNFEWQNNPWLRWVKQLEQEHISDFVQLYQWLEANCGTELTVSPKVMPIVRYLQSASSEVRQLFIGKAKSFRELNGNSHIPIVHQEVQQQVHGNVSPLSESENLDQYILTTIEEIRKTEDFNELCEQITAQSSQDTHKKSVGKKENLIEIFNVLFQGTTVTPQASLLQIISERFEQQIPHPTFEELIAFQCVLLPRVNDHLKQLSNISPDFLNERLQQDQIQQKNFEWRNSYWLRWMWQLNQKFSKDLAILLLWLQSGCITELCIAEEILPITRYLQSSSVETKQIFIEELEKIQKSNSSCSSQSSTEINENGHPPIVRQEVPPSTEINENGHTPIVHQEVTIVRQEAPPSTEINENGHTSIVRQEVPQQVYKNVSTLSESKNLDPYIFPIIEEIRKTDDFNRLCKQITDQSSQDTRKKLVEEKGKMIESLNTLYRGETITLQASLLQVISERFEQQIPHPTFEELIVFQSILGVKLDRHIADLKKISPDFLNERLQQDQLQQKNVEWRNRLWALWMQQLSQKFSKDLSNLRLWLQPGYITELFVTEEILPIARYLQFSSVETKQICIEELEKIQKSNSSCSSQSSTEINGNNHIPIVHQEVPEAAPSTEINGNNHIPIVYEVTIVRQEAVPSTVINGNDHIPIVHQEAPQQVYKSRKLNLYILTAIEEIRKTDDFNRMCEEITAQSSQDTHKNFAEKKANLIEILNTLYQGTIVTPQASLLQMISERFEQQIPYPTFEELIVFQYVLLPRLDAHLQQLSNISPNFLNQCLQQDQLQQKNFEWRNSYWLRWMWQLSQKFSQDLSNLLLWLQSGCIMQLCVAEEITPIARYLQSSSVETKQIFIEDLEKIQKSNSLISLQSSKQINGNNHIPIVHEEVTIVRQEVPQQVHKNISPLSESENLDHYILTTIEKIRKTDYFNRMCKKITDQNSQDTRKKLVEEKEKMIKSLNKLYRGETVDPQASFLQIISERFEQQIPYPTFEELIVFQNILHLNLDQHIEHLKQISPDFLKERQQQDQLQQKNFEWQNNLWLRWVTQLEQECKSDLFQLYQWLEANCETELTVSAQVMPIVRYLRSASSEVRQRFIGKFKSLFNLDSLLQWEETDNSLLQWKETDNSLLQLEEIEHDVPVEMYNSFNSIL